MGFLSQHGFVLFGGLGDGWVLWVQVEAEGCLRQCCCLRGEQIPAFAQVSGCLRGWGWAGQLSPRPQYLSMTPPWLSVGVLQVPRPWRQHAAEAPRGSEGRRSGRHFQHSVLSAV